MAHREPPPALNLERIYFRRAAEGRIGDQEWAHEIDPTKTQVQNDLDLFEIDLGSIEKAGIRRSIDTALKRLIDIVLSATALVVGSPLLLGVWIAIRVSSPGPAFFSHRRIGAGGVYFDCFKFRTMVQNADELLDDVLSIHPDLREEYAQTHKLKDDPRVTRIGNMLRKTSLDEFPQFWNVLKGDMSIVGPRPIVTAEVERYGHWLPLILELRPGITGLWQVSGRNDTTYAERIALDRRYALTRNLATDFSIMLKTPSVMIKQNGAY
ncbi:MAG TPA: sugar transferase [Acidimicrobiia bacterium]|jgi:undecaprenyl-phosphate galactose phosphotransferase|nr:sugar transferase [Acidimicrobiia bacterium]